MSCGQKQHAIWFFLESHEELYFQSYRGILLLAPKLAEAKEGDEGDGGKKRSILTGGKMKL